MSAPTWPTNVSGRRIIDYTQSDREDGYSFQMSIGIGFENGVESIWHYEGDVVLYDWGSRQVTNVRIENVPPTQRLSETPVRIERTLTRGSKHGDRYETKVEGVVTFADGTSHSESQIVGYENDVGETGRKTEKERREALTAIFQDGNAGTGKFAPGKVMRNPVSDFRKR